MTFFIRRHMRNGVIAMSAIAVTAAWAWLYHLALRDASFLTGWLLLGCVAVLALFNGRKKLPVLPLLSAAAWLQFHVYFGVVALALFLMHTEFRWPNGGFEIALWTLFMTQTVIGIVGLFLSRHIPPRLARHTGERIIFERIPVFRAKLAERVEALAIQSIQETKTDIVAKYYKDTLMPFMAGHRNFLQHPFGSRQVVDIQRELESLRRNFNDKGRAIVEEIQKAVDRKHTLDFQHAWLLVLKGWLFVHIPLTWVLLILTLLHLALVYSFGADTL